MQWTGVHDHTDKDQVYCQVVPSVSTAVVRGTVLSWTLTDAGVTYNAFTQSTMYPNLQGYAVDPCQAANQVTFAGVAEESGPTALSLALPRPIMMQVYGFHDAALMVAVGVQAAPWLFSTSATVGRGTRSATAPLGFSFTDDVAAGNFSAAVFLRCM